MATTVITNLSELTSWISARNSQGSYTEHEYGEIPSGTSITLTSSLELNPVNAGAYYAFLRPQSGAEITGRLWPIYGTRPTLTLGAYVNLTLKGHCRVRGLQLTRDNVNSGSYILGNDAIVDRCIFDAGAAATNSLIKDATGYGGVASSLIVGSSAGAYLCEAGTYLSLYRCTVVANGSSNAAFRSDYSLLKLFGTAVYGFSSDVYGTFDTGNCSYNATSRASAIGSSGQTSITSADFVSTGAGTQDYAPASGSAKLLNTGAATAVLSSDIFYISVPQGASPDIGAVEKTVAAPTGPTIDTQPTAQTANEGATATFTGAATTSGGSMTWAWERQPPGGGAWSTVGTSAGTYTTAALDCATDHGASIRFTVTDSYGSATSNSVALTVRSVSSTARPSADVTTAGWTASAGTDFFALIDEVSASDADYITSPTISGSTAPATFAIAYPLNTGTWAGNVRAKTSAGGATMRVYLLNDAGTVVGTSADQAITSTWTTYALSITTSGPATRGRVEIVT